MGDIQRITVLKAIKRVVQSDQVRTIVNRGRQVVVCTWICHYANDVVWPCCADRLLDRVERVRLSPCALVARSCIVRLINKDGVVAAEMVLEHATRCSVDISIKCNPAGIENLICGLRREQQLQVVFTIGQATEPGIADGGVIIRITSTADADEIVTSGQIHF